MYSSYFTAAKQAQQIKADIPLKSIFRSMTIEKKLFLEILIYKIRIMFVTGM